MKNVKKTGKTLMTLLAGMLLGAVLFGGTVLAADLMGEPSSQTFYVNGEKINIEAYNIGGYNYVKLGDLSPLVGFDLAYDGTTNSVYIGERPAAPSDTEESCLTNGKPVTEENVLELLRQIEQDWPTGTIWGTRSTPGTHKNEIASTESGRVMRSYHVSNVYGCGAYASMVSSLIFGDETNPCRKLEDLSQIRPGDIIFQIRSDTGKIVHVMLALESPSDINAFHITEGNAGGTVQWPDREDPYGRENLDSYRGENTTYRLEVWTRYPESVPYTGNSVMGWPTGINTPAE